MLKKLTSRKFAVSLISVIAGIAGMFNISDSVISLITGILMVVLPTVVYVITEGTIDRANVICVLKDVANQLEKYESKIKKQSE